MGIPVGRCQCRQSMLIPMIDAAPPPPPPLYNITTTPDDRWGQTFARMSCHTTHSIGPCCLSYQQLVPFELCVRRQPLPADTRYVSQVVSPIPVWRTVPLRVQLPVRLRFTGWHASVRGCVRRDADACTHDGLTADRFSLAHGCVRDGEQAVAHGLAELCCM